MHRNTVYYIYEVIFLKTTLFSIRLPIDLKDQLQVIADKEDRSIAYIIIKLLREAVNHGK